MFRMSLLQKVKYLVIPLVLLTIGSQLFSQELKQIIRGTIIDSESRKPLPNVNIICITAEKKPGCVSDSSGNFRLTVPVGRHALLVSHVEYNPLTFSDILVVSGKSATLNIEMVERVIQKEEISVRSTRNRWINPMATVSARSLRSQDAERYAGGYFDPLRMVTNFAGIASGKSDDNNEIIIRGNSPRGLLWRLEGIEIPNPNHFSNGQGGSGGGFSSITTNALSSFDFFTGAFPAEFGNAYSGVMDLNLKNAGNEKREYSIGLSMLGLEGSAEGPLNRKKNLSFLGNYRLADFSFLTRYNLVKLNDMDIIPHTRDWVYRLTYKTEKAGTFDLFALGGTCLVGDKAVQTSAEIKSGGDNDEFTEENAFAIAGLKHTFLFPNQKTFLRTTVGYTFEDETGSDRKVDTLLVKTVTYAENFVYDAFRAATMLNHKFNAGNSLRAGFNFNYVWADLYAKKLNKTVYDTLLDRNVSGWYSGYYIQWKYRSPGAVEINTGVHFFHTGISSEFITEPRLGLIVHGDIQSFNLGLGFHSRLEPLSVYGYRVKVPGKKNREIKNADLKALKAFHFTAGYNLNFSENTTLTIESYFQYLYKVPVNPLNNSYFSMLNSSAGLPDYVLVNEGKGKNSGIEVTLEKSYSRKYYYLLNASLLDSKFMTSYGKWFNTYYNSNYVVNALGGKDFVTGAKRNKIIGLKLRCMYRGGFRFTPPDVTQSLASKRLVYDLNRIYGENLPAFRRFDFGGSYRINNRKNNWIFMLDIQNLFDYANTESRRFEYKSGAIHTYDYKTLGIVPVFSIKTEF